MKLRANLVEQNSWCKQARIRSFVLDEIWLKLNAGQLTEVYSRLPGLVTLNLADIDDSIRKEFLRYTTGYVTTVRTFHRQDMILWEASNDAERANPKNYTYNTTHGLPYARVDEEEFDSALRKAASTIL